MAVIVVVVVVGGIAFLGGNALPGRRWLNKIYGGNFLAIGGIYMRDWAVTIYFVWRKP